MKNFLLQHSIGTKHSAILLAIKITIIVIYSFSIICSCQPFYTGSDAYLYAVTAIRLATTGQYEYESKMYSETQNSEFLIAQHVPTKDSQFVPLSAPAFPYLISGVFLAGGYWSLFFIVPFFTISLVVITERIATKVFNPYVGLLSLVFVTTHPLIFSVGRPLLTDNVFMLFMLLGCFYLILFFDKPNSSKYKILASSFFVIAVMIRHIGVFSFILELALVLGLFLFEKLRYDNTSPNMYSFSRLAKQIGLTMIPWSIFFILFFSYNYLYFDNPFTTYMDAYSNVSHSELSKYMTFSEDDFHSFQVFAKQIIPRGIMDMLRPFVSNSDVINENLVALLFLLSVISLATLMAYKKGQDMKKPIILSAFILGILVVISLRSACNPDCPIRYAIPSVPLFSILFALLLFNSCVRIIPKIPKLETKKIFSLTLIVIVVFVGVIQFEDVSFFHFPQSTINGFNAMFIDSVQIISERYPLHKDGVNENTIVVARSSPRVIEYGAMYFKPLPSSNISEKFDPNSINYLKTLIDDGHDVRIFKNSPHLDRELYRTLFDKHSFLIDDSECGETFCQLKYHK